MESKAEASASVDPSDLDLVQRTRAGDESAFGELIRRYQKTVYRIAFRMVRDPDGAEDVTQITFVKAFRSLHRFKEEYAFHPWLYRIAVNASLTHIDRRKRERKVDIADVPERNLPRPAHDESPLDETGRKELMARVDQALEKIPAEQKAVFLLRVVEGLSYEEIARTLDIPKGTVMSRLSRAREALRNLLV
jgi:RNA polymerase sigma-70 factor (ECF subfamily)